MELHRKLLVVDVAALGWELLRRNDITSLGGLSFASADGVFPALTCPAQAAFRTAAAPATHGMVANGLFDRRLGKAMFWEQSARLVEGPRFWQAARAAGKTVGMLFWQQAMGESADVVLTPAPIHKHHGGMITDCYSQPAGLYDTLCKKIGRPFALKHYWGPMAKAAVGEWIAEATACVLADTDLAPDLLLTYLPSLDYDLQRHGPDSPQAAAALADTLAQLATLTAAAEKNGYDVLIFGDYAIGQSTGPAVFPNRLLRDAGLLSTRTVSGMDYPDLHTSPAFAMVDHEIAHVYLQPGADIAAVADCFQNVDGIADVLDAAAMQSLNLNHPNAGDLLLTATPGRWFAYPWWTRPKAAPDYASHIDIHNKPGYDPCELFFQWFPPGISQNTAKIRGSHGLAGPGREIAYATTLSLAQPPASLTDLAQAAQRFIEGAPL